MALTTSGTTRIAPGCHRDHHPSQPYRQQSRSHRGGGIAPVDRRRRRRGGLRGDWVHTGRDRWAKRRRTFRSAGPYELARPLCRCVTKAGSFGHDDVITRCLTRLTNESISRTQVDGAMPPQTPVAPRHFLASPAPALRVTMRLPPARSWHENLLHVLHAVNTGSAHGVGDLLRLTELTRPHLQCRVRPALPAAHPFHRVRGCAFTRLAARQSVGSKVPPGLRRRTAPERLSRFRSRCSSTTSGRPLTRHQ